MLGERGEEDSRSVEERHLCYVWVLVFAYASREWATYSKANAKSGTFLYGLVEVCNQRRGCRAPRPWVEE